MKVAVILGVTSYERDVSLKTGKAVVEACRMNNYAVEILTIDKNYKKFLPILKKVDIVFNSSYSIKRVFDYGFTTSYSSKR